MIRYLLIFLLMVGGFFLLSACNAIGNQVITPSPSSVSSSDALSQTARLPEMDTLSFPPTASPVYERVPVCPDTPTSRLIVGERGYVVDDGESLNLREQPGTDQPLISQIPSGASFDVLAGPVCEADYAWYRVRYEQDTGWIAEGDQREYYALPYLPG